MYEKKRKFKIGDLVQMANETWLSEHHKKEHGVGLVVEHGQMIFFDGVMNEVLIKWSSGELSWEWDDMLEKVEK